MERTETTDAGSRNPARHAGLAPHQADMWEPSYKRVLAINCLVVYLSPGE
jgi:hypothetical protein